MQRKILCVVLIVAARIADIVGSMWSSAFPDCLAHGATRRHTLLWPKLSSANHAVTETSDLLKLQLQQNQAIVRRVIHKKKFECPSYLAGMSNDQEAYTRKNIRVEPARYEKVLFVLSEQQMGSASMMSKTFSPKPLSIFFPLTGPMPRIIAEPRYFSMPSTEVAAKICVNWASNFCQWLK